MNAPTEIIRRIFLELCPPEKQTKFPLKPNQIRVSLTHVSSRWRAVALATPELWTNIFIQIDSNRRQPNLPRLLNLVNIWISRSGQSMLSFDAVADDHSSLSLIFDLIRPHIHRCSLLSFHGLDGTTIRRLLSLPPSSLSSLQTIIIVGKDSQPYVTSPSEDPSVTTFQPCPQLRSATLLFYGHGIDVARFNLPWHQSTNLDLSTFSASSDTLLGVLSKCTSLEYCDIRVSDISPFVLQSILPLSNDPIVLPFLQRLALCFPSSLSIHDGGNGDSQFLAALRCPSLCELTLVSFSPISPSPPSLQLFYGSCSGTLEFLDLIGAPYNYLPDTLRLLPRLTTLYADISSLFLYSAQEFGEGTIAPRLTTLGVSGVEIGEFLDVVEARVRAARANPNIASFTQISLSHSYGDWLGYAARVAALREVGVDIGAYDL